MLRKLFSERMGLTQPKLVQINDLDDDARMALYNAYRSLSQEIFPEISPYVNVSRQYWQVVVTQFLKMGVEHAEPNGYGVSQEAGKKIKNIFLVRPWHESFNLMEFIYPIMTRLLREHRGYDFHPIFTATINQALEQENVGFRFMDGQFVPIQNQEEQETIERALDAPYAGARKQIRRAVSLFSARPKPDYANSIKDSIGAVESICQEISGEKRFSAAVDKLGISMHPAFQKATKQLYGFTSDEAGIRHASTGESSLHTNQATARYMLIVCSAMVNFITDQKRGAK